MYDNSNQNYSTTWKMLGWPFAVVNMNVSSIGAFMKGCRKGCFFKKKYSDIEIKGRTNNAFFFSDIDWTYIIYKPLKTRFFSNRQCSYWERIIKYTYGNTIFLLHLVHKNVPYLFLPPQSEWDTISEEGEGRKKRRAKLRKNTRRVMALWNCKTCVIGE